MQLEAVSVGGVRGAVEPAATTESSPESTLRPEARTRLCRGLVLGIVREATEATSAGRSAGSGSPGRASSWSSLTREAARTASSTVSTWEVRQCHPVLGETVPVGGERRRSGLPRRSRGPGVARRPRRARGTGTGRGGCGRPAPTTCREEDRQPTQHEHCSGSSEAAEAARTAVRHVVHVPKSAGQTCEHPKRNLGDCEECRAGDRGP